MTESINKKLIKALDNLDNKSVDVVKESLSTIKKYGNESVLEKLIDKIIDSKSSDFLISEIYELLNSLKLEGSQIELIRLISLNKYNDIKDKLISTCWNSKLDYSNFIDNIVSSAVNDNFLVSIECLSVIENMRGPFKEEQILDSKMMIKKYFDNNKIESDQKNYILKIIYEILETLDRDSE